MSPSRKNVPSAVIGLDIGSDSIKVTEAKYGKEGITITGLGMARTPAGTIENEIVVDPKALGSAIKTLLSESGIKTKKCVSSVAGQSQVVARVIRVPKMNPKELGEAMKWEIERQVPFSPAESVFDFQALDNPNADPDAQEMEVLLAVAREELINSHVETLKAAGLQPMAIDIESLAAGRSLLETTKRIVPDEVVGVVNIGANSSDLVIFDNGIPGSPLPLGISGSSFTREISESLGQAIEEAEVTKKEYAVVNLDGFADDSSQAEPADDTSTTSEQTSYDTPFSPDAAFTSVFDVNQIRDTEPDTPATPAADDFSNFSNTVDAPAFDTSDQFGGPAFDLGGDPVGTGGPSFDVGDSSAEVSAGPSFDLGSVEAQADAGPSFDLGVEDQKPAEPAAPSLMFDLDDDEPAQEDEVAVAPSFDLSDTVDDADPGKHVDYVPNQYDSDSGAGNTMEDNVFKAISGVLMDLVHQMRNSLDYYSTQNAKMPEKIYLCGGTSKMPKLDAFLTRELGIPVVVADPVKNLPAKVAGVSEQYLREISPLLSVSIGLAIRDMIG